MDPALEFCMSASVCEMRGDYNFEKRCNKDNEITFHFHVSASANGNPSIVITSVEKNTILVHERNDNVRVGS